MKYILENEQLKVMVDTKGAELQSLYSKALEKEYLWQPGAEIWNAHSILLFPNPGRIAHDRTIIGGKEYPATMHGFAKDMEFTAAEASNARLVLELAANPETRFFFPYAFLFRVIFALKEDVLEQRLEERLTQLIGEDGTVQSLQFAAPVENGLLQVTLVAECREEIGREVPSCVPVPGQAESDAAAS